MSEKLYKKALFLLITLIFLMLSNGRFSLFFATWISSALLLYWIRTFSPLKGLLLAWLFLTIAWSLQFYGMVPVPSLFYILIASIYGLINSVPYFLDLLLVKKRSQFLQTLIFPCSWALIDYLTQLTPYGSWGNAAYSQHSQIVLLQSISIFGMSFITFLIGWFASISNWAIVQSLEWRKVKKGLLAFGLVILFVLGFGSLRLIFQNTDGENVRIASLSAPDKEDQQADPELRERFFANNLSDEDVRLINTEADIVNQDLINRSINEALAGAKIIFWGESNGTVLKQSEQALFQEASRLAIKHQIYLGLGLGTMNPTIQKPLENKLVLFAPRGDKVIDYWKAIPVPGGEAAISATKGTKIQTTETPFGTLACVICFDMDFPNHLKQARDVDILLVPSNDWKAIDPWHTHMSRFRAIEQGFNMVRHTSNGLSIGADYTGRVLSQMDHYSDNEKVLITHLPTKGVTTVYSIIGDTFPILCFLFLILLLVIRNMDSVRQYCFKNTINN